MASGVKVMTEPQSVKNNDLLETKTAWKYDILSRQNRNRARDLSWQMVWNCICQIVDTCTFSFVKLVLHDSTPRQVSILRYLASYESDLEPRP